MTKFISRLELGFIWIIMIGSSIGFVVSMWVLGEKLGVLFVDNIVEPLANWAYVVEKRLR